MTTIRKKTRDNLTQYGMTPTEDGVKTLLQQIIVEDKKTTLEAAAALGCSRSNVVYWLKKFKIENPRGRGGANNPYGRRGKSEEDDAEGILSANEVRTAEGESDTSDVPILPEEVPPTST